MQRQCGKFFILPNAKDDKLKLWITWGHRLKWTYYVSFPVKDTIANQYRANLTSYQCTYAPFPGWKNMAVMPWFCHDHTMIMAKHGHDHSMMTTWWPCFLAWSSWFMAWSWYDYHVFHNSYHDHGMIIIFSKLFLKKNGLSIFSQIVAAIYLYMAHLTVFRGFTPPNCQVCKN